jgi:signal transduction histidine kinase
MDIHQFMREITPQNVLDILDPDVLSHLLDGYSFVLKSGITVLYPTETKVTMENLKRKDALGQNPLRTFNPLCAYWRSEEGCNRDQDCVDADKIVALKYYEGGWSDPKDQQELRLYRCRPLGLWDMTYPLRVGDQVVGVLFGGQIIVEGEVNWRETLRKYDKVVDWTTCPDQDIQSQTIERRINTYTIPHKDDLLERMHLSSTLGQETVSEEGFKTRIDNFQEFGQITQRLLDELYKAKRTAAEQRLLREYDTKLAEIALTDSSQWWADCAQSFDELKTMTGIENVRLYARSSSRYICKAPRISTKNKSYRLSARKVLSPLPTGKLMAIRDAELLAELNLGEYVWGYRSETGNGREGCSTFLVFKGTIDDKRHNLLEEFCKTASMRMSISDLIFSIKDSYDTYRGNVGLVAHSLRSPLESFSLDLEDMEKFAASRSSNEMELQIKESRKILLQAKFNIDDLLESIQEEPKIFDIIPLLDSIINNLGQIVHERNCEIKWQEKPTCPVMVYANEFAIYIGLNCILDNAVKYSFSKGKPAETPGQKAPYIVYVKVESDDDYVQVIVRNYGIGMSEKFIKEVLDGKPGTRAYVPDSGVDRYGTGWGIPTAVHVFKNNGGWFDLKSRPADQDPRKRGEEYHRYVTYAYANLPKA